MKKSIILLSLFACVLALPGVSSANEVPVGYLDYAGCDSIYGWTCDADDYSKSLEVHFYYDGEAGVGRWAGSAVANIARETAVGDLCGGKPAHGFAMPTPDFLKDGQSHNIYAYAINTPAGSNPLLSNGQKTMQCAGSQSPIGYFDSINNYFAFGWACDADDYSKPLTIYFYDGPIENQRSMGSVVANSLRTDPGVGNVCGGHAWHGFNWELPDQFNDGAAHTVYAYAGNFPFGGKILIGSKKMEYRYPGCQSECASQVSQCFDDKSYQNCSDNDGDGCFELSAVINCTSGQVCEKGKCVSANITEKRLSISAVAIADKSHYEKRMYFFPFPANEKNINILGFSGSLFFTAKNKPQLDMSLNSIGIIPGPCPQNKIYPDWPSLAAAYPQMKNLANYILKTFVAGTVSAPVDFRFDKKIPFDTKSQCIYLLLDGGFGSSEAILESRVSLIYESNLINDAANSPFIEGFGYEYIFPLASRNDQSVMYVGPSQTQNSVRLFGMNGNISIAAYTDIESDWTAFADGYIFKNCSAFQNGYQGGQGEDAVVKNYYALIPSDAVKIYSAQFQGHGQTAVQVPINKSFPNIVLEKGHCLVGLSKFISSGGGKANAEIQLASQLQKIICAPNQVSGCKVCLDDGTGWQDDNSKCGANQTCQNGSCVNNPVCAAKTCATLGNYHCGDWSDGCGATINCGSCAGGKTCSAGQCTSSCTSHASKKCDSNNLYWYNSCNAKESLAQNCAAENKTCRDNACVSSGGGGGGGGGGTIEPQPHKLTRAEILAKIAEIKKLLIQLIIQLITELQKQLAAMQKIN